MSKIRPSLPGAVSGQEGRGRVTDVRAEPYVNKYEWLQVLLVVLLFCLPLVLVFVLYGAVFLLLPVGLLELVVSWKMSTRLTFRASEAPTSVRSALGGLRPWLLVSGALITILSVAYWPVVLSLD
jgi:hypothetical protein